jgi:hypothetical protein
MMGMWGTLSQETKLSRVRHFLTISKNNWISSDCKLFHRYSGALRGSNAASSVIIPVQTEPPIPEQSEPPIPEQSEPPIPVQSEPLLKEKFGHLDLIFR